MTLVSRSSIEARRGVSAAKITLSIIPEYWRKVDKQSHQRIEKLTADKLDDQVGESPNVFGGLDRAH
ncbi:hypothetical protein H5410_014814 [Solanum commersonii]|uniref:Uncharacterized protein n=1 Tax=Solanum commersonii TaxID=4109 RepID=A0A9J5ZS00_SOLCO|nr:hypothetical protein H5410_014814 [Solanum commersonii]